MITVRPGGERGHAQHGWLDSRHTFSFADYHDPKHMGFRSLRVINEDRVMPGRGFGMHGHRDMEILSYVISGSLAHRDSMGHEETLRSDEVQRISAGAGIMHSEFNPSKTDPVHFLQIWIEPAVRGIAPSYAQTRIDPAEKKGKWKMIAGPDLNQDARVFVASLSSGGRLDYPLAHGRHAWLQVISGNVTANGTELHSGDGAAVSTEPELRLAAASAAEILLFDLA